MVESETEIICCQDGFKLPKTLLHPECLAIDIPQNDFFYGRLGQRCMEFVRSMPAERPDCNLGPREQVQLAKSIHQYIFVFGSRAYNAKGIFRTGNRPEVGQNVSICSIVCPGFGKVWKLNE